MGIRLAEMNTAFNIDKLLKPYERGGTKENPVRRTLSTIASKLLHSYKFNPEVVGKAIFSTFWEMANNGLEFKGDGSYDSGGTQLFTCIRDKCVEIANKETARSVVDALMKDAVCLNKGCPMRTKIFKKKTKRERFIYELFKPRKLFFIPTWRL